jgi:hypothetical protein
MSFVGPRALRPFEIESSGDKSKTTTLFDIPGFKMRSSVTPGLTGVAQVFASRSLSREEKFKYDLWYIENKNFWLDIKLILKSIMISLRRNWDTEAKNARSFIPLIFVCLFLIPCQAISAFAQGTNVVPAAIDVHSRISDGLYSQEKIANLAKDKGIKILIFSESALRKWEYGIWPLRNIIKKTYQENSVLRMGIGKYMNKFAYLQNKFPDLVLIPGMELSPYFYWQGSPLSKRCALMDYYKQFLIIGIDKSYGDVPLVGNRGFSFISRSSLIGLWPVFIIIFGILVLRKRILGISLIVIGLLFLVNNLPFSASRFNAYQGYKGVKPYQDLIDYVNRKGGIIFWAHPQALSQKSYFGIESYTHAHLEDLLLTHDYTGFGLMYYDIAEAGSIWDRLLLEYIAGKRKKPVWIIGNLHYTGESAALGFLETLFFLKDPSVGDVLNALRTGKMYARFNLGGEQSVLNEFSLKKTGVSSVEITIKGSQFSADDIVKIELIRNGVLLKRLEVTGSQWSVTENDEILQEKQKVYYRLKISTPASIIVSNPIFAESAK